MNQPRIAAKVTFLGAAEGGRDVLPAKLSSGQYRPHIVIDPNQLGAVTADGVPEETYLGLRSLMARHRFFQDNHFWLNLC